MRIGPIAWIAGQVVLAAVVVVNVSLYMIGPYYSASAPERVSIGWPYVFLTARLGESIDLFRWEALLLDVIVMLVLVSGTVAAVARWDAGANRPDMVMGKGRILVALIATLLLWRWLFLALGFEWIIFLAWCALAIVFAAAGCACYAFVAAWRWRLPRFSLRMLIAVVTFLCVVLALGVATRTFVALAVLVLTPLAYTIVRYLRSGSTDTD